jgi:hypothetical protein
MYTASSNLRSKTATDDVSQLSANHDFEVPADYVPKVPADYIPKVPADGFFYVPADYVS